MPRAIICQLEPALGNPLSPGSLTAAPAEPGAAARPVVVPESLPAAPKPQIARENRRDAEARLVVGVEGGVAGSVAGGMVGGTAAPAAPRTGGDHDSVQRNSPAPAKSAARHSTEDRAVSHRQLEADGSSRIQGRFESELQAQPDTMIFRDAGVNRFVITADDRLSTFALDVDTGSYTLTRSYLERGTLPPAEAIRLEEFVNAFDYGYADPLEDTFAVHIDGGSTPFSGRGTLLLRMGIQARDVPADARPAASLTFVIDTSGSMQMENRLELVKDALRVLVGGLRADDSVAIVEFGSRARVVLEPTSAAEPEVILDAIDRLTAGGSTNAQAGLELGYDLAVRGRRRGAVDRVVLASDGVANVGLTDAEAILRRIDREVDAGVDLVAVGVGMGNFNDVLLEQLANRGNGFYAYINDRRDAERLFGQRLTASLVTVARDAKVQVEFRPESVGRYRLLGYEKSGHRRRRLPRSAHRRRRGRRGPLGDGLVRGRAGRHLAWRRVAGHHPAALDRARPARRLAVPGRRTRAGRRCRDGAPLPRLARGRPWLPAGSDGGRLRRDPARQSLRARLHAGRRGRGGRLRRACFR